MAQETPIDFDLWRRLLDEHPDELVQTRHWAINLHEAFLVLFNDLSLHLPGIKEIQMEYGKTEYGSGIHFRLDMEDDRVLPLVNSAHPHLEENAELVSRIENLMQQETDKHLIKNMYRRLVYAMESWSCPDAIVFTGIFGPSMTLEKAQEMLGEAYPHWQSLNEKDKINQNTAPATKQASGPIRRM